MSVIQRIRTQPRRAAVVSSAGLALLVLALAAVLAVGASRARLDTGTATFLPGDDAAYRQLEEQAKAFGGDPVVVLLQSTSDRELFKPDQLPQLIRLEGELASLPDVASVYGPGTALNQTAAAAGDMLAQISGARDSLRTQARVAAEKQGLSAREAAAVADAAVSRFDDRYGRMLVQGMDGGLPTLSNQRFVETVMFDEDTLAPRPQWRFVVPRPDMVAVLVRPREGLDQLGTARLVDAVRATVAGAQFDLRLRRTTVTGVPAITAALADRAGSEFPVLGAASVAVVGLVFLLAPWTGRRRSRWRPTASALVGVAATIAVFGWTDQPLSLGVVAFVPILLGIGSDFPLYLSRGGRDRSVLTAAAAAAAGFGSLALSPLPFVRELGIALAIGITATVLTSLALRALLGAVPPPRRDPERVGGAADDSPSASFTAPRVPRRLPPVGRVSLAVLAGAVAISGWVLLPRMTIEADQQELARGLPELADADYAASILGSSGEVALVTVGPAAADPDVLAWSRDAESRIITRLGDRVHPILSMADLFRFLGDDPTPEQVDAALSVVPRYLSSAVLNSDRTRSVTLLGVEFDDLDALQRLVGEIRAEAGTPPPGVRLEIVGLPVVAARGLDLVSEGRLWLNGVGLLLAGAVLLVGLRRRSDAVRALLTVALATGWVVALADLTVGSLNPLTVAIGSLTTATGCEFAVMLAGERRRGTLVGVATAAVAGTAGYLVLGFSEVAVLRDFGLLLAGGVSCSFVAALLVTRVLMPSREARGGRSAAVVEEPAASVATTEGVLV